MKYVGKLEYFANFRDMVEDHLAYASGISGFRLFRFRAVVVIVDGVQKRKCEFMVKRKMNEKGAFHNFQCKENVHQVITLHDKPLGPEFYTDRSLWPAYVIPPISDDKELQKYELSLRECRARIERTVMCREKAAAIVTELQEEINMMREGRVYAYDWDTSLYTNPPDHTAPVMGALPSPEEQQDFEELMKEKASDRLYRLENGLALNLEEVTVGNMVIIDHGEIDEHGFPFSVARVDHIYNDRNSERYGQMRVCYHTVRFSRGQKKAKIVDPVKLLSSTFVPDQIAAPNANKRSRKATYVPYLDFIEKDNIILVFERLMNKGRLPPAIQQELRTINHPRLQAVFGKKSDCPSSIDTLVENEADLNETFSDSGEELTDEEL